VQHIVYPKVDLTLFSLDKLQHMLSNEKIRSRSSSPFLLFCLYG